MATGPIHTPRNPVVGDPAVRSYSRHSETLHIRPGWVIGTRLLTFAVTVGVAWPYLHTHGGLQSALFVYAAATILTFLLFPFARRWDLAILTGTLLALQIVCELAVISQIVYCSGGLRSPSNSLYMMTIISAALSYRLPGTLFVAAIAAGSFLTAVWVEAGHRAMALWSPHWFDAFGQFTDEDFYAVFLRLCVLFLCAFTGGYLAERLYSRDEALAHTSEALRIARWETGDILKHLRSGVLTLDLAGHIVYFNRAAEEIVGLSERSVRGRPLRDVLGAHYPELADRLEWVLGSQQMDIRTELIIQRPDGKTIPIGLSTSVLGGSGAKPRGLIAVFADLSDVKLMEEKMRAQDRLAAVGELSAAIAHEIRNPLAAISGSVEVLKNELDVSGENRRLLDLIIKESSRLNKILSDFLLYARLTPVVTGRVFVAPVLEEVFEIARHQFQSPGTPPVDVRADMADRPLAVGADADHLKQILINLVFNGLEACAVPPRLVTVRVRAMNELDARHLNPDLPPGDSGWVTISVADSGGGIPVSVQDRLYEPFVSTKPNGTGLGLAIVRRLVDNAGGRITAESTPGEGTTFTVFLRRCVDVPVAPSTHVAQPAKRPSPVLG